MSKDMLLASNQFDFLNSDYHLLSVRWSQRPNLLRINYLRRLNNNYLRINEIEFTNWKPRSATKTTNVLMIDVHYYFFFVYTNVIAF